MEEEQSGREAGTLAERVERLKRERGAVVLAHYYVPAETQRLADYVGDSFYLARLAKTLDAPVIVLCGVSFMAESVKLLSPERRVLMPEPAADCPMAHMVRREDVERVREATPDLAVVAYVNTTAEVKRWADVCVTSSSAEKIISAMPEKDIIFIPDINLGTFIKDNVPEKEFKLIHGGCPTHVRMSAEHVKTARKAHPDALVLVHPECKPEVTALADYVGSTSGIMKFAKQSDKKEFIIGTENSIVQHLQFDCPDKMFYPLSKDCVCHNMKLTTLVDVLNCLKGTDGDVIEMSEETRLKAKKCIDEMLRLG